MDALEVLSVGCLDTHVGMCAQLYEEYGCWATICHDSLSLQRPVSRIVALQLVCSTVTLQGEEIILRAVALYARTSWSLSDKAVLSPQSEQRPIREFEGKFVFVSNFTGGCHHLPVSFTVMYFPLEALRAT